MKAAKSGVEKLMWNEREQRAWWKLPAKMREQIAQLIGQPELNHKIDHRKGEHSHWVEKRASKVFVVRTPDGKKHAASPAEAASMVDCSEKFLVDHMNKPLTKFERSRTYTMSSNAGDIVISWAGKTNS